MNRYEREMGMTRSRDRKQSREIRKALARLTVSEFELTRTHVMEPSAIPGRLVARCYPVNHHRRHESTRGRDLVVNDDHFYRHVSDLTLYRFCTVNSRYRHFKGEPVRLP
jgi:hypothetical protein